MVTHIRESWWFESMYTLQGKIWLTHHTFSTLNPCMTLDHMYLMWSTYSNPSWVIDRFRWIPLLPRKRSPNTIHSMPADRSTGSYLGSLPSQPMKQLLKPSFCRWPATRLIGPKSPVCDWYVQYLLARPNPSVLNWHRQELQPWMCRLSINHSLTFPTDGLHFPPRGPTWSAV
jgi:hypothetical protein